MLKSLGKYIVGKMSGTAVGRVAKWGFWTGLIFFGPTPIIGAIGITGLTATAITVHSGILEYTATKTVNKILE
jgi:uncharacterized protein (DUF697 family)